MIWRVQHNIQSGFIFLDRVVTLTPLCTLVTLLLPLSFTVAPGQSRTRVTPLRTCHTRGQTISCALCILVLPEYTPFWTGPRGCSWTISDSDRTRVTPIRTCHTRGQTISCAFCILVLLEYTPFWTGPRVSVLCSCVCLALVLSCCANVFTSEGTF